MPVLTHHSLAYPTLGETPVESMYKLIVFQAPARTYKHITRRLACKPLDSNRRMQPSYSLAAEIKIPVDSPLLHTLLTRSHSTCKRSIGHNLQLMQLYRIGSQ